MNKLMTHLYYGDVSPEFSEELAITLINSGSDILEIGIPYSDPVADGPIFQKACREALVKGITPFDVLSGIKRIRKKTCLAGRQADRPIYLTSYFGPIFKTGIEMILKMANEANISGLIIPDLPVEEQENYPVFKKFNLPIIQFATVYSSEERLKQIVKKSKEFIYCVSLPGITGDRVKENELKKLIIKLKKITDKKIFCGFGIKTAKEAKNIIGMGADGVIVGSAIAEIYQPTSLKLRGPRTNDQKSSLGKIGNLVRDIKNKLN